MVFAKLRSIIAPALGAAFLTVSVASAQVPIRAELVSGGFSRPVYVTTPPNDPSRLFIVEKTGRIKIFDRKTQTTLPLAFLNIDPLVGGSGDAFDERGLLGLAFHWNFESNRRFYVNYTDNSNNTVIAEYRTLPNDNNRADASSAIIQLTINQPFTNHNGGWMGVGPDNMLYIVSGDGGAGCDPFGNGQNVNVKLGKILRYDITGMLGTFNPAPGNPFEFGGGDSSIWAYGIRNAWRCSFDRATGDFYIADVGQDTREEVNVQLAGTGAGANYGWDCKEGLIQPPPVTAQCPAPSSPCTGPFVDPVLTYSHSGGRCSEVGGYVYRGCRLNGWDGRYFFGDTCSGEIFSGDALTLTNIQFHTGALNPSGLAFQLVSFGEDANGEHYVVQQGSSASNGTIWRVVPDCSAGDIDGDCDTDATDLMIFVNVLLGNETDCGRVSRSDMNYDTSVDGDDIQLFVNSII